MSKKVKLKFKKNNFINFLTKLKDLSSIDDTIKIKIDSENILIYSMFGGSVMLAFKNYLLKTDDYFDNSQSIDYTLDIIIPNCNKFVKNLEFLYDSKDVIFNVDSVESRDDEHKFEARKIQISGDKLKINWISGELYEIRDINKDNLYSRINLNNKKWGFKITKSQFSDIKKLSSINSGKLININVLNGKINIYEESSWEIQVGDISDVNSNFSINKKFLKCINDTNDFLEFHLFENFILVNDEESNLMLSYEQSFDDD